MFDRNKLDELDMIVCKEITNIQRMREIETKAYIEGMQKGAELMYKNVRAELQKELQQ